MKNTYNNQTTVDRFKNAVYGGITVSIYTEKQADDIALAEADLNLSAVIVKARIERTVNGKKEVHDICNDNLSVLAGASSFDNSTFKYLNAAITGANGFQILTAHGASNPAIGVKSFVIPFGGAVDTRGSLGGTLVIEVTGGACFQSTANTTASYIQTDALEIEGIERYLPRIQSMVIEANQSNVSASFEGMVRRLNFLNLDKSGVTIANQVVSSASITHDGQSRNVNFVELLTLRGQQFQAQGDDARNQCFDFLVWNKDKFYQDVNVTLGMNTANVTASKNYLVAWTCIPKASSLVQEYNAVNAQALQLQEVMAAEAVTANQIISQE